MKNIIIPAAGRGSRFKELGKLYPKCLLPVNNKPIIQYNIETIYDISETINVVIQPKDEELFKEVLSLYKTFDKIKFKYPDESNNEGPLTSIWAGRENNQKDYLIILSDIIIPNITDLDFSKNFVTYEKVPDYQRWCLIDTTREKNVLVDKPKEKPDFPFYAVNGIYNINKSDFFKIQEIIESPFNIETQISFWLKDVEFEARELKVLDFGTLDEYRRERKIPNCRHFNSVDKNGLIISKSSENSNKIFREYSWLKNIPIELQPFAVRTFDCTWEPFAYNMESIPHPTMREYMLFLGTDSFDDFLSQIKDFIEIERNYSGPNFFNFLVQKTETRMKGIFSPEQIKNMIYLLYSVKETIENNSSIMHGDLVASNIFFDENSCEIKVIDPNGDLYGSFLYDLAKLNQSFTTPYDYIDSGLYVEDFVYQKSQDKYKDKWRKFLNDNYSEFVEVIDILTLSLMCSLIPLHSDTPNNQELYKKWCEERL